MGESLEVQMASRIASARRWTPFHFCGYRRTSMRSVSSKSAMIWIPTSTPAEALAAIHETLARAKAAHSRVFSHGKYIDILPHRASKGRALRYLTGKWNTPLDRVVTAGDSGNDRDMLTGQTAGIAVGNHDPELASLRAINDTPRLFRESSLRGRHHRRPAALWCG